MRSASSVGANYRAASRAQSRKAFIAKLAIVEEEADESLFWLEMLEELAVGNPQVLQRLKGEADELVAIIVTSKKTAKEERNAKNEG
jgi:four helix bundle protein